MRRVNTTVDKELYLRHAIPCGVRPRAALSLKGRCNSMGSTCQFVVCCDEGSIVAIVWLQPSIS